MQHRVESFDEHVEDMKDEFAEGLERLKAAQEYSMNGAVSDH